MTWTRLSDDFPDRPELLEVSRSARLLHIEALIYGNRQRTDGRIPTAALPRLSDSCDIDSEVEELIEAGVWRRLHAGAVQITQWTTRERQESADAVTAREQYNAEKQERYRARKAAHQAGDHSLCVAQYCATRRDHDKDKHGRCQPPWCAQSVTGNATGHTTGGVTGLVTDSPPLPAPPRPEGGGEGAGESACDVCSEPAAVCRSRAQTSGHTYTPQDPDRPRIRRGLTILAAEASPQEEVS